MTTPTHRDAFSPVHISAPDNARATLYPYGGHVVSWTTPDGVERLFLSDRAELRHGAAIRGGVPVIFPQFSGFGPLLKHGFARSVPWRVVGTPESAPGTAAAHVRLRAGETTRQYWDTDFQLDLTVTVGGPALTLALAVTNTDARPYTFAAALHTYLRISDIATIALDGLHGLAYREFGVDGVQDDTLLRFDGEVDRIYWNVPGPVTLHDGDQRMDIAAEGFPDVVTWNPGAEKGAALADMTPDGYRRMVCVEAGLIGQPVTLAPGAVWRGTQRLTVRA